MLAQVLISCTLEGVICAHISYIIMINDISRTNIDGSMLTNNNILMINEKTQHCNGISKNRLSRIVV